MTQFISTIKNRQQKFRRKRIKTPTVLQMEAVECGAASLTIILHHYKRFIPLEEVRITCGVSRDGSNASNVLKAARQYGFVAKAFKKTPQKIFDLRMPVIIFWNFNHFLVLEGWSKNHQTFYLNDPASGPRTVDFQEFDESFTGVVLVIEPGPDFKKSGRKASLIRSMSKKIKGLESAITFIILTGLGLIIPGIVIPIFAKIFVDNILIEGLEDWVMPLLLGMSITALFRWAFSWVQQYFLLRLEIKMSICMATDFFWHILHLPVVFFGQRYAGDIESRVAINDRIARILSGEIANHLLNLFMIVFYAALMWLYDPHLTIIAIVFAGLNMFALQMISRKREDASKRLLMDRSKLYGTSASGLMTIDTIKAGSLESDFFSTWAGHQAKVMNGEQALGVMTQALNVIPPCLSMLCMAIVLSFGAFKVINGQLTIGMLVAFQSLAISFLDPVNRLVSLGTKMQEIAGDINRLDDVLQYPQDIQFLQDQSNEIQVQDVKLSGHLELRNVSFGYSPLEDPLIKEFNLILKPGMRVALVGGSGSGKSTIAKLVCGLYQPWSGEILFDGKRRDQISRQLMANSFSFVDQDIFLFEGSITDNLSMWDPTIPKSVLIQAARDACIHDEIAGRPSGYDSIINEDGKNFSGGQRQRLEIARALAANPSILVLDEATSALDPSNEKMVDENIRQRGCTCLIVAHRLSAIRDCDEIIVLDQGNVVQRGMHHEMKKVEGPYAELIRTM
jgi:NHLM bacteriocin system ABC transporter peptidase/ATP-binding protein